MRFRNVEIKPIGGAVGCLTMVLISVVLSVALTLVLNYMR
ncbi:hypothetical protein SAMN05660874_04907 [Saccharopolyspora flava]|uniref:Uncharacterized protein n=1 Tax=Saccharopolyspora flava TaxID=95161 RepID=A0A1I6UG44_9PSEU|nr:hypothetical protein SAMN05660874_04907 [Saccharopolyspora flava]